VEPPLFPHRIILYRLIVQGYGLDGNTRTGSWLFRPSIPNSARGIDGGPRRFTEVVLNEQSLPVAWWSQAGMRFLDVFNWRDGANEAKPESTQRRLSPGFESSAPGPVGRERSQRFGGQEFVSRPGGNGEAGQVSHEGTLPVVVVRKVDCTAEAEPGGPERWTCVEQSNH